MIVCTSDSTGFGKHGDYVFGWKNNSLQKAIDNTKGCMGANCGGLKTQLPVEGNRCAPQNREGWMWRCGWRGCRGWRMWVWIWFEVVSV